MARTKASATASFSSRTRPHRLQHTAQFAQDPESKEEVVMEEVAATPVGGLGPEDSIKEASSAIDSGDEDLSMIVTTFESLRRIIGMRTTPGTR
jgi:hypothetical protein